MTFHNNDTISARKRFQALMSVCMIIWLYWQSKQATWLCDTEVKTIGLQDLPMTFYNNDTISAHERFLAIMSVCLIIPLYWQSMYMNL